MFLITQKSWVGILLALMMALVLVLILVTKAWADSPIVHEVHAGGPDVCEPLGLPLGCDANFSLVAFEFADGSVKGQWTDRFPSGDGFHAAVDCVSVDGNQAWLRGVITKGSREGIDLAGQPVFTSVRDNGTSANDPPDQISISFIGVGLDCHTQPSDIPLFDVPQGNVVVK